MRFLSELGVHESNNVISSREDQVQEIQHASVDDPVLKVLRHVILEGWPQCKSDVPQIVHPYFNVLKT